MRMIELTMVVEEGSRHVDEDGIAHPGSDQTCPVSVEVGQVRCFYPRKGGRTGTRLTFNNSAGMAVTETYAEVKAKFAAN